MAPKPPATAAKEKVLRVTQYFHLETLEFNRGGLMSPSIDIYVIEKREYVDPHLTAPYQKTLNPANNKENAGGDKFSGGLVPQNAYRNVVKWRSPTAEDKLKRK